MVLSMAKADKLSKMVIATQDPMKTTSSKEKVSTHGEMEQYLKASSKME